MTEIIIEITNCIVEIFVGVFFFSQVLLRRNNNKLFYWGVLLCFSAIHISRSFLYLHTYVNTFITLLLWSALLIALYKDLPIKKLIFLCIYLCIGLASDVIARFVATAILNMDYTLYVLPSMQRYIAIIIYNLLNFVLLSYIAILSKRTNSNLSLKYWIMTLLFPLFSLFIVICTDFFILQSHTNDLKYILVLFIIIGGLLYFNTVVFDFIDTYSDKLRLQAAQDLIKKQAYNYKLMETNETELRYLKHNIKKHMSIMQNMLDNNSFSATSEFMDSLKKLSALPIQTVYTNDITLDSILNVEGRNAQGSGIDYIVKTHKMRSPLNIDPTDKSTILCNAIDNAIEACAFVDKKFIVINIISDPDKIVFCIENSSQPIKQHNNLFFTSKSDTKNHGIGILSIKYVLKKYNGKFQLSYADGIAKCVIALDNPPKLMQEK